MLVFDVAPTSFPTQRFQREAKIWSTLIHVPFYGLHNISSNTHLVSPWIERGDLFTFLRHRLAYFGRGRPPASGKPRAAFYDFEETLTVHGIASVLAYLHTRGVIHGDLKAPNILLGDHLTLLLCDFGISKNTEFNIMSSGLRGCGTLRWKSPELTLVEEPRKSEKSDIYAFAMTIVEILTGEVPFRQYTDSGVHMAYGRGWRPPFEPISRNGTDYTPLWELAAACWQTDPIERLTTDEVVKTLSLVPGRPGVAADDPGCHMNGECNMYSQLADDPSNSLALHQDTELGNPCSNDGICANRSTDGATSDTPSPLSLPSHDGTKCITAGDAVSRDGQEGAVSDNDTTSLGAKGKATTQPCLKSHHGGDYSAMLHRHHSQTIGGPKYTEITRVKALLPLQEVEKALRIEYASFLPGFSDSSHPSIPRNFSRRYYTGIPGNSDSDQFSARPKHHTAALEYSGVYSSPRWGSNANHRIQNL
ncbi:hypothetical protein FRB94_004189 [Tulasnella sp. JGI-2019a]|nr:hypothetical protein FRB94_004189 [Tulasnella sp. JGI-2019a]